MTPLQLAKANCCNYRPDGRCLGVTWDKTGRAVGMPSADKPCVLADPKQRCEHFERCVLPVVPQEAADYYTARGSAGNIPHVRLGKCGHPVEKGKRFCPECLRQRRKKQTRDAVRRFRSGCKLFAVISPCAAKVENGKFEVLDA